MSAAARPGAPTRWRGVALAAAAAALVAGACASDGAGSSAPPTTELPPSSDAVVDGGELDGAVEGALDGIDPSGPGCAVAVSVDGEEVVSEGAGLADLDSGAPITPDTRFDIGSVSKSVTAATVVVLARRGVLSPDDGIRTWLPELPESWDDITVDDLLHHTGGVPPYEDGIDAPLTGSSSPEDALAVLVGEPELEFEPGTDWAYSNSGYFLLSLIVARATGEDFDDVVASQVLDPVALDDTFVRTDWDTPVEGGASGYAETDDGDVVRFESRWAQNGDGAVQSTANDLLAWVEEWGSADALGVEVQRAMQSPVVLDDGSTVDYGAGLELTEDGSGRRVVGHDGSWPGYSAAARLWPDDGVAAAVLCNLDDADAAALLEEAAAPWLLP